MAAPSRSRSYTKVESPIVRLSAYIQKVGDEASQIAVDAIKEQIDIEAQDYYEFMQSNSPETIVKHLRKTKIEGTTEYRGQYGAVKRQSQTYTGYGYLIFFEGVSSNGMPYEQIAKWYNNGTHRIEATYFITRATRRLKGLDNRAYYRFQVNLNKALKEEPQ